MMHSRQIGIRILVSLLLLVLSAPLQADITPSGDVDPTLPDYLWWWTGGGDSGTDAYIGKTASGSVTVNLDSDLMSRYGYIGYGVGSTGVVTVDGIGSTWNSSDKLDVGHSGQGTLNITNGGAVSNSDGCIGFHFGSTGEVTVDGSGSTWANSGYLYVGDDGQGTLNITNGGAVNVTGDTWVARFKYGSTAGEINFDVGTLTTVSLLAGPTQLTGTGTINTHGLVSDVDLLFDSAHDLNQTLTLNESGQNITINLTQDSTGHLGAGYAGNGTLAISDGVLVKSNEGYIGYKVEATGVVMVDGNGSTWNSGDFLYVGYYGQGALNITNGGAVSNSNGYIGYNSGSTNVVTVDGSGSTWTSSNLIVGDSGQGMLNITNGGAVSSSYGRIGYSSYGSTGVVTVDGSGSTWTNSGYMYVGFKGHGTLNITNGGAVSNDWGIIGLYTRSTGVVTVDGSGSTLTNSYSLYVGSSGHGTLNITNGGAVSNTWGSIGYGSGSTGVVTVDGSGSTWTNNDNLYVGGRDSSSGGTGELTVSNGGAVEVAGTLKIWSPGTVQGDGTITANVIINAGAVKPGISPGILSVNGDYTQEAGGLLEIELAGTAPGSEYDRLVVSGTASLDGTLDLSLIGEYMPDYYDDFEIMTAGTVSGRFDLIDGMIIDPEMYLAVVYDADSVLVVAALPGDVDLDRDVDFDDFTTLRGNYGEASGMCWQNGDIDGDGDVDFDDYTALRGNYGSSSSGSIPEPATLALLGIGLFGLVSRRKRR